LLCLCIARITLARRLIISVSSVIHLSVTYVTLPRYARERRKWRQRIVNRSLFLKLEIS